MQLQLRTITPLHIGNGEELAPLDYIVYDKQFYHISQDKLLRFIAKHVPDGHTKFANWISSNYARMREERNNRNLVQMEADLNAFNFCYKEGKSRELIQFLNDPKNAVLKAPVILDERAKERYQKGRSNTTISLGRVREAVKTGRGKAYVPGSSIKGALRTAVFYHYLKQYGNPLEIEKLLRNELYYNKRIRRERFGLPLIHQAFYCQTQNIATKKTKENDEKMDLFKLVRFSDGILQKVNDNLNLAKVNLYLVERKMNRERNETYWIASQQPQTSYCEIIPPGQDFTTELDFDITFLLQLKSKIKNKGIYSGGHRHWINIEEKVKQLFGLDLSSLNERNQAEKKEEVLSFLMDCQYAFSIRQQKAHRIWLDQFAEHDDNNYYTSRMERGFNAVIGEGMKPFIHLGYATGFDGMTALFYFLDDQQLSKLFKEIMEKFGIGKPPRFRGKYTAKPERFPKSKRLVETDRIIQPLGWLGLVKEDEAMLTNADSYEIIDAQIEQNTEQPKPQKKEPKFYTQPINFKKPPVLDAVVIKSGNPNLVKVFLTPDNMPEMKLNGYRSSIEEGKLLRVNTVFTKKGKLVQVSFKGRK